MSDANDLSSLTARVDESRADAVTLFEDRAEVTRRATVELAAGPQWVALRGATPFLDDRSLRVECEGVGVGTARVVRRMVDAAPSTSSAQAPLADLEAEVRKAERAVREAAATLAHVATRLEEARELLQAWLGQISAVPHGLGDGVSTGSFDDAYALYEAELSECMVARRRADEARVAAEERLAYAAHRLSEAQRRSQRLEAIVLVQLEAAEPGRAEVTFAYHTPCALWRPEHLARLDGRRLELVTWGTCWQATGEDWRDVTLTLSTARPARPANAPFLEEELLALRRKSEAERKQVVLEAREQTIATAGAEGARRALDEMPGVDDGGEPLAYAAPGKVNLPSDGRPLRVELLRRALEAEVAPVLLPEKAGAPHLRARATLTGGPLLAGPVRLAQGPAMVGRGKVDFVAPGDALELGFGPDDGVRARRQSHDERDTQALTGTQRLRRHVTVHLSNLSGEARTVRVIERVPVSELESLAVSLVKAEGWRHDARDGFLQCDVELPARGTRSLQLAWELKASSGAVLPF